MELKPCPCCGGEARDHYQDVTLGRRWHIACGECGLSTIRVWHKADAVRLWNTRYTSPEVAALVEVCEGARARSGWVQRMYERLYVDDLDDNLQEVFWRFILNLQSALAPFQESTEGDREE